MKEPVPIMVKTLAHFEGSLPDYQTPFSSGFDVRAANDVDIEVACGARALVPTGLIFEIPEGHEIQVRPRSGLAHKFGVTVLNSPGTIDADYRGEVKILLINLGENPFVVKRGERIAQLVLAPVSQARLQLATQISETVRGEGGFGSTGL